jgi:hypothetical protein
LATIEPDLSSTSMMFGSTGLRVALISSQGGPSVVEPIVVVVLVGSLVVVAVTSTVVPEVVGSVVGVPVEVPSVTPVSLALSVPAVVGVSVVGGTVVIEVLVIVVDSVSTPLPLSPQAVDKKEIVRIREADAIRIAILRKV